jgi:hypothetical protein
MWQYTLRVSGVMNIGMGWHFNSLPPPFISPLTPKILKKCATCLLKLQNSFFFQILFCHSIEGGMYLCFTARICILNKESRKYCNSKNI